MKLPLERPVETALLLQEEGTSVAKARTTFHSNTSASLSPPRFSTVKKELHAPASTSILTVPRRVTLEENPAIVIVIETYCYPDYSHGLNPTQNRSSLKEEKYCSPKLQS